MVARNSQTAQLPKFDGDPLEWPAFRQHFVDSTKMCRIGEAENLLRLRCALHGKARETVRGYLISGDPNNVNYIMNSLQERFSQTENVVQHLINEFKKTPRLRECYTLSEIADIRATIHGTLTSISLAEPNYLQVNKRQLLETCVDLLPTSLKGIWIYHRTFVSVKGELSVDEFLDFLQRFASSSASAAISAPVKDLKKKVETKKVFLAQDEVSSETVNVVHSESKPMCKLCGGNHKVQKCQDYLKKTVDERWAVVKDLHLCAGCLVTGHSSRKCRKSEQCNIQGCRRWHHKSLHNTPTSEVKSVAVTSTWLKEHPVLLKVVPVTVSGPLGTIDIFALLDDGSTITLLDEEVANTIGARGRVSGLKIMGVNKMTTEEVASRRIKLRIKGKSMTSEYTIMANTVCGLSLPQQLYASKRAELRKPGVAAPYVRPSMLIGQDNAHLVVSREVKETPGDSVMQSRTALGWVLHGGAGSSAEYQVNCTTSDEATSEVLKRYFEVDSLGVSRTLRVPKEEEAATIIMDETTKQTSDGRWETGLLWKDDVPLPNNYTGALSRLRSLERKLAKDKNLATSYQDKMHDLISKGYAVPSTTNEESPRKWYLPHFAVINPNKPGKIRVVFDAAARFGGTSLNDHLLTGPDILSMLLGNILRFREGRIGVAADIREMFLRIKITPQDQMSQLFLWRESPEMDPQEFKLSSMMFGARCSPASAQYVRNRVAEGALATYPEAAEAIMTRFYMDDYLNSHHTEDESSEMVEQVTKVLASGGFDLVNWASNSPRALRGVPPEARAAKTVELGGATCTERVLGVHWDPNKDVFVYNLDKLPELSWPTKRELLSEVMKVFDPLGFIGCVTIQTKILLQDVWRSGTGWDEPILPQHADRWSRWLESARSLTCTIRRCCREEPRSQAHLHIFCDASESACCAVAYLVEGDSVHFLGSKCKVAPLKPISIPRMELQAALMGARLAETLKGQMKTKVSSCTMWSDSTTVLTWIKADPRQYNVFVANRLGEIVELTQPEEWRWVPTKQNPADLGTRDLEFPDLSPEALWFGGPEFLRRPEVEWPGLTTPDKPLPEANTEMKAAFCGATTTENGSGLPDPHRFSSWNKLLRVTAWVLRFTDGGRRRKGVLAQEELKRAEIAWVKQMQRESFSEDYKALASGKPIKKESRIAQTSPRIEDGLLKASTRLEVLQKEDPFILCADHPAARLFIRHAHEAVLHGGTERTVAEIKRQVIMLRLRTNTKKIIHNCIKCKLERANPSPPLMGQLPLGRLAYNQRPFNHCGVDLFGPMEITVGRRREKRYGALFTCLTTRAVHLEVVDSLDADATIMALRRMTARRGTPAVIYSDNGTNFTAADKEISQAMAEILKGSEWQAAVNKGSRWVFNPPSAPHFGGAWERMVRSVKTGLRFTLKERAPRLDTLLTVLAEVEHTINSRPLTHVTVDPRDDEPLTPNHFLIGCASGRPQLAHYGEEENEVCLRRQWRIAQQMADRFWRRWLKEYLPTIAQRKKWREPSEPLKVGDLVAIVDPGAKRNEWRRGVIVEVRPGADKQVRAALVRTSGGRYLLRPAVKLLQLLREDNAPSTTT
jgi:transposase InsO family protein